MQSVSSLHSSCPNHLNLPFLVTKLTRANHKKSLNSAFLMVGWCLMALSAQKGCHAMLN